MFQILAKKGSARLGKIQTLHGDIFTPAFGPDATRGLVKNIAPHELLNLSGSIRNADLHSLQKRHEN